MSRSNFDIHWATADDRGAIDQITRHFSDDAYSHSDEFFTEAIVGHRALIAYAGGNPAGYLIGQFIWGNTPFLSLLRVLPDYQRQGLGKKLLSTYSDWLTSNGYEFLISSSELVNDGSKAFHQALGFADIGTLDMIYGQETFYKKRLT